MAGGPPNGHLDEDNEVINCSRSGVPAAQMASCQK